MAEPEPLVDQPPQPHRQYMAKPVFRGKRYSRVQWIFTAQYLFDIKFIHTYRGQNISVSKNSRICGYNPQYAHKEWSIVHMRIRIISICFYRVFIEYCIFS